MADNRNLNSAARAKKDEFYTQLRDIENELRYYRPHFAGKTILCNCDDPYESEFFKYFAVYFNVLGLKKLIATSYASDKRKHAIKFEVTEVRADFADVKLLLEANKNAVTYLEGDGDFRSPECIAALREADIVVTNPPFSLFREYVAQLVAYEKKFIIVGNMNAITYKEIFPLIMQNKIWLGYGFRNMVGFFHSHYEDTATASEHREGMIRVSGVHWFTNLDIRKRHEDITLFRRYSDEVERYPRYDNYDAIEVSKTADIPEDYFGVMGVPITFLDKYNPAQFEILGHTHSGDKTSLTESLRTDKKNRHRPFINGKQIYARILIRRREK